MNYILVRTEVFGDTEINSYCPGLYRYEKDCLSVIKAEVIRKILRQREYPTHDTYKDYGHQREDKFYIRVFKDDENEERIFEEFEDAVFPTKAVSAYHTVPNGWEEIIPENYVIKEVAFRNKD